MPKGSSDLLPARRSDLSRPSHLRRHPPETPTPAPAKRLKAHEGTISSRLAAAAPLPERLRPRSLDDFVGQNHLTDTLLQSDAAAIGSMIFWGPPGCGKTTLARLLAKRTDAVFKELSATIVGINDVRPLFEEAKKTLQLTGRRTIIFLDEVHRFTKSQQDIFLPFIEQGHVQLIGATTENPSFKLNGALLSRCRVFVLERLSDEDIIDIVKRAIRRVAAESSPAETIETEPPSSPIASSSQLPASSQTLLDSSQLTASSQDEPNAPSSHPHITAPLIASLASLSAGDARTALSLLSLLLSFSPSTPPETLLAALRQSVATSYDRTGDDRYDLISALHKSVRGSDGSAAMYWLARMLEGGEDPVYVARRMAVCASEDIGLADRHALPLAMAALAACQQIGMPECRIHLAHCVAYLAEAPKSTRAYDAYDRAAAAAKRDMTQPVPVGVRNAPTALLKAMGHGVGYRYNPAYAHPVTNTYLPPAVRAHADGARFLFDEGDQAGKVWDEEALAEWEVWENGGRPWEGRSERVGEAGKEEGA
ncbi:P-loop containing nucleoside triphosphate hydrolase protein [Auriscalpium vulgare]|uniref:P-loop containing nucleoside triphosphate hydrolase protein n=1 Tax=Auriscalpium vulgare TaxID=40419 RepID=A0ACB8RU00_9AGAM|nr:P-loop containing nucleoside triphosphate hydrolase protein [Auriscalpium vulgare]